MTTSTKVRDEITGLKNALKEKTAEIDAMTGAFEVKDGKVSLHGDQAKAYLAATEEAKTLKALIDAKASNAGLREWLDAPEGGSVAGAASAAHHAMNGGQSLGEQFLASESWAEYKGRGYRGRMTFEVDGESMFRKGVDAGEIGAKDVFSAMAGNLTGVQALGNHQQRPLVEKLPRLMHVRNLFPPDETTAAILYGIRQTGFVNNAAAVRERTAADGTSAPTGGDTDVFGRAPRSKLTLEVVTYPLATISHVMYAHQQTLDDEPRMRGLINRQLIEGVRLEEDDQILFGNGQGANIRGILNTTGVQTYNQPLNSGNPSEKKTVTLRRAITRVQLAEMAPTGIIINPLDWEDMELETDDNGRLTLVTSIAVGAEERVWRLPVVATTAMPEGRYLLGAFGLGAQLFDRRSVQVDVSTENQDLFERDGVTLKGHERVGLTVDRPEAFVQGTLHVG
ncbi:phage major capsid protein [Micromonospora aurantiaca (nom. illeg.)]|uniref:phage major capsid protein n=1 Tax=Micromonospora aurantiaca (nom. illeg.) TaxID=47850 RepID=UPI00119CC812|nr:phage major capsid protein [Micromonospora aurantiaca]MBC9000497.1 phage major capsid protein [Micromonospora aurantiaca]